MNAKSLTSDVSDPVRSTGLRIPRIGTLLGVNLLWILLLAFPLIAPNSYVVSIGVMFFINLILISSLNLIMGYCGQISLGHAGFYGLGAYVSGVLSVKYGVSPALDILCAAIVTGFVALIVALPSLRLKGHYLAMGTLGLNAILSVLFVELVPVTGGPNGLTGIASFSIGSLSFGTDVRFFYLCWAVCLLVMWGMLNLTRSRVGRAMNSLAGSEIGAASLGVNTYSLKVAVFVLSATMAAIAGSLYAHFTNYLSPETFNSSASVMLMVMVAVGGRGKYWGSLTGALLFTLVPELLRAFHDLELLIFGGLMIAVLMFFPGGIAGLAETAINAMRRRRRQLIDPKAGGGK